jgi:DHA1 family multidrug resistance protein-like MFS transporter
MPSLLRGIAGRLAGWARRWDAILPLLLAELIVWLGFGALLPIMPIYFTEHGVDLATLGVVIAAWPAARLVGEPIFGFIADRTRRVPLMVAGNVGAAVFLFLPLILTGVGPFITLRALAGLSTALYDPAARGYIADATPADRRGEAFGLYGAAQMGGLLLGPAIGGIGAALFGGVAFIFVLGGVTSLIAAVAIAARVREQPRVPAGARASDARPSAHDLAELGSGTEDLLGRSIMGGPGSAAGGSRTAAATTLRNRWLIAAILFTIGASFAYGTYEVIWSVFLEHLGAGLELIGLTFAMFGLPILVLSPWFGRRIDRGGLTPYLVAGTVLPVATALLYPLLVDPVLSVPLILVEATGSAIGGPAIFSIVAAGSPAGRSSTAQGLVGATGTLSFVVASLVTGRAAEIEITLPFYLFAIVMTAFSVAAFAVLRPWTLDRARRVGVAAPV